MSFATLAGMKLPKFFRRFGPGLLVTAAFIGPGTVTKATTAGANFGHTLLWAIGFSVIATIVFQEMASRLGIVTGRGLGEAIRPTIPNALARGLAIVLVVSAIIVGNAAYQAGNIAGAAVGVAAATGMQHQTLVSIVIGLTAWCILMIGHYRSLQRILVALVVTMSCVFLLTALSVPIDWRSIALGWIQPTIPDGGLKEVLAIIGTTVVPYNLFLHATASAEKWSSDKKEPVSDENIRDAIQHSRGDTILSVGLGGLVTAAVMATATAAFFQSNTGFTNLADAARQLEPLLGNHARWLFGVGLFAAGLTSTITAPLAAAYAAAGCFGWPIDLKDWRLRTVFTTVIVFGTSFAASGSKPTDIITFAQIANGLLLPLLAIFLLAVMNNAALLGKHRNHWIANTLGVLTVVVVSVLGLRSLVSVSFAG
ncbi:Manganese transport protein mntH1 [Rhodopirellula baltica SH 1]|uniref:Manganese transport protein mntH1 n=2 Tax=Rhodopirellula baltica TaxID=265606 RepID=Q7UFP5_RHOBA|nr:Nramp family divalent metal transporter [Rhodopirellula baltica]CAD78637.1 Manganese transport protein mntH1 [Rhodopirellula baltica SH 1]